MRVLGTVFGGILGIVTWEMTRGNPYGICAVCFVVYSLIYPTFLSKPQTRVMIILTVITHVLVSDRDILHVRSNMCT